ncbi:MAG TPA: hypothetical protein VHZ56_11985, partial [Devosia sp.]|nr:hypothetical protein [Devosia sp.]
MARAYQQSQPADYGRDPAEWQSLRQELVALLDTVDNQVARAQPPAPERTREPRYAEADDAALRQREALRSVQRQLSRFEEPAPPGPPNPRDTLQSAINQIRARQGEARQAAPPPAPPPVPPSQRLDTAMLDRLTQSFNGLTGRLERLEGEIKAQIKTGTNIKDVADQVAQLAHVVELLAGAVGETGQVKRLEGQIASLGKIMAQGREMDIGTLTRRLDDVASTVGKLAELQVGYADRVQNPVDTQAFQDGMRSIETSVRNVYDRIDALERHSTLSPSDLDHVVAEMARFTETLKQGQQEPLHLVELVDALNTRIADIESGDRLLHGLRKDLSALRDAVIGAIGPRFDALEQRMDTLGTREDMAEIWRQIGMLGDRIGERPIDPGIGQLEAQVRHLVARMDQTGEQLSGLARLYASEPLPAPMPDFDAVAEMVAARTAEAVRGTPDPILADTVNGLEARIAAMLEQMHRDPEIGDFGDMQAGISEVNERLKRLETSLLERRDFTDAEAPARARPTDIATIIAATESAAPPVRRRVDSMPRSPTTEAPLAAEPFPEPAGPVQSALDEKAASRKRHPGLDEDLSLAARYDAPVAPMPPSDFELQPSSPPAPMPSAGFMDDAPAPAPRPVADHPVVATSSRNTFIEAARRAAQRQTPGRAEVAPNSLIGRA